jgi:acetolactate synthase-1/2/3 large subunit
MITGGENMMRGADLLVRTLASAGITRIFALSGNQIMPIFDACFDAGIEIVHTRHEAAAVFMAEAYAQLTGTVGVALAILPSVRMAKALSRSLTRCR